MYARLAASFAEAEKLRLARVAAGTQPEFLYGTSTEFLVIANVLYLGISFALYKFMLWKGSPFNCKAFKSILLVYNATCVFLAGYVAFGMLGVMFSTPPKFVCNDLTVRNEDGGTGRADYLAKLFWVFYAQKFWEFLDTWFFLLRMSFRQLTFLHMFHHCSINIVVGIILPYDFSGDMYLPIFLNACVHLLMYSHYIVTAMGWHAWWKQYLTSLQLTQFVLIATQSGISLYKGDACGSTPFFAKIGMCLYMGSMLFLFGQFFLNAYVFKKPGSNFGGGVVKKQEPLQISRVHSGRAILGADGCALVTLPSSYMGGELQYQITPIGKPMPELHISVEPSLENPTFGLGGGAPGALVSWTFTEVTTLMGGESPKPKAPNTCCGASWQDKKMS